MAPGVQRLGAGTWRPSPEVGAYCSQPGGSCSPAYGCRQRIRWLLGDRVSRAEVDPQLLLHWPNVFEVTRIAADELLDPSQNLRPGSQITETRKPSDEPLRLADFNHPPNVASWLRPRNAALLVPIKDDTSFERYMGGPSLRDGPALRGPHKNPKSLPVQS